MIIDIHAHTSKRILKGLHTGHADIEHLRQQAERYGIGKIYLMATYFPLKGSGLNNLALLEMTGKDPLFGCFGSLNLEENPEQGISHLEELAREGRIEGIKLYPGYQNVDATNSKYDRLFQVAAQFGLPVACHMGELHHCCPRDERGNNKEKRCGYVNCPLDQRGDMSRPGLVGRLARKFPSVTFLASHLGNPHFQELRDVMASCSNVYTDISGQFVSATDEDSPEYRRLLAEELKEFLKQDGGIERIMFGTDFPIQSYKDSLEIVESMGLKQEEKKMVLSGNAQRILPPR